MPIGKTIADFGDTGDADKGLGSFSTGFGASPAQSVGGFGSSTNIGTQNVISAPAGQPINLTQGGSNAAQGAEVLVENTNTDWINNKWRPVMGWMYMLVCTCDFVLFPVLWSVLQAVSKGQVSSQWQPLTLQGAGLFHLAMGAVLGVAAYGRTKEKLESKQ
jgi:hypothetical protein